MKKILITLLFFFLGYFFSYSQATANLGVWGYVKDSLGNPIVGKTIYIWICNIDNAYYMYKPDSAFTTSRGGDSKWNWYFDGPLWAGKHQVCVGFEPIKYNYKYEGDSTIIIHDSPCKCFITPILHAASVFNVGTLIITDELFVGISDLYMEEKNINFKIYDILGRELKEEPFNLIYLKVYENGFIQKIYRYE